MTSVSHQWCDFFLSTTSQPHATHRKVEGGERDTQVVHRNEATVAWPGAIACHRPRRQSGVIRT
jgi:hypothetical protein